MKTSFALAITATCAVGLALSACNRSEPPAAPAAATPAPAAPAPAAPAAPAAIPVPSAAAPAPAAGVDMSDPSSSALTTKAWQATESGNPTLAIAYADKVIELYGAQALEMQAATTEVPATDEGKHALWALNDVGTSYFIKAETLEKMGKKDESIVAYKFLAEKLPLTQCFDPKGWFWSPANAAREKLQKLEFDAM